MVRKPTQKSATPAAPGGDKPERERIIAAFMALLADKPIEQIGFAEIAKSAGVSLSESARPVRLDLGDPRRAREGNRPGSARRRRRRHGRGAGARAPVRRRMPRLEVLAPHRAAVRSLTRSAMRNPGLAFALNGLAVGSSNGVLTAADIDAAGPRGMVRAQGLAVLFASVLRTWAHDDDPGRTMAALDRALARGQRWSGFLDGHAFRNAWAARVGGNARR